MSDYVRTILPIPGPEGPVMEEFYIGPFPDFQKIKPWKNTLLGHWRQLEAGWGVAVAENPPPELRNHEGNLPDGITLIEPKHGLVIAHLREVYDQLYNGPPEAA